MKTNPAPSGILEGKAQKLKVERRQAREAKKALERLTLVAGIFLRQLDEVMKEPSTVDRGKKIAKLSNYLEYERDRVRYITLGVDFRHDPEIKDGKRLMPTMPRKKGVKP